MPDEPSLLDEPTAREVYARAQTHMKDTGRVYRAAQEQLSKAAGAYYREAGIEDFKPPPDRGEKRRRLVAETRLNKAKLPWHDRENVLGVLVSLVFLVGVVSTPYWVYRLLIWWAPWG